MRTKRTSESPTPDSPKRPRRSPGKLPPPPPGVAVLSRPEAAAFMGVSLGTFGIWERDGRVTIPRYRAPAGPGLTVLYAVEDLTRLREELRKLEEPHPDPQRPGVYRVPIRSDKYRLVALIDAEDLPKVEGKHWNVSYSKGGKDLDVILSTVTERMVPLKRVIMGVDAPECRDQIVDFINSDPLDCRRANLVITTRSEVIRRRPKTKGRGGSEAASAYKGVGWDTQRCLWKVQIGSRETHRVVGRFRDEAQAAAAYDAAAREMYGDAALLNFPDGNIPAPTYLDPEGKPVREMNAYRVPRGLPAPPPGVPMLSRHEAAEILLISTTTLCGWEKAGHISIPRYRVKDTTGNPIFYAAADITRLRDELDKVGQPYPDPHPARAGVWRVPLRTLDGYLEALIDEADLHHVQGRKWNFAMRKGDRAGKGVVFLVGPRDIERVQLNRLIMGLTSDRPGEHVVHANGNSLDCRRANLVLSTFAKGTRAAFKLLHRSGRPTTSRFKGVFWTTRDEAWAANIRVDDVHRVLGHFDDEEDAALAYDDAAREAWGQEARVNFPRAGELPSAAAPVNPAELSKDAPYSAARLPGKPRECTLARHDDGSVTLSWRCVNAAAGAGVTFTVSRRLPGQREFAIIGTVAGTTHQSRVATFTDATVPTAPTADPTADVLGNAASPQYTIQASRGTDQGEVSDVLTLDTHEGQAAGKRTRQGKAA
ncbi:MAG: hypothetical protein KF757_09680 [Phycisphaeraceae bacterium]|nr:hypothetical protein [Phycisphaeraceae bacterium]MCW5763481.1 hypothetical protein [Phycisphaeraceae bacterium]